MTWKTSSLAEAEIDAEVIAKLEKAIEDDVFLQMQSVVIVRGGKLAYEKYFQGTDADHQHNVRSASKSITSTAMGIAIDQGLISGVNELVFPYFEKVYAGFKNWEDVEKHGLTIRDFLTMSSCLECDDWNEFSRGNEERMYLVKDWVKFTLDLPVRGVRWEPSMGDQPPIYDYSYCTGGVVVLGALIEQATGRTFEEFVRENLFEPMGIRDYEWSYTPTRQVMTGGGLNIRPRDMAKYGWLYLKKGNWEGQQLVSEAWVAESVREHIRIDEVQTYGYLWWRRSFEVKGKTIECFFAAGNGGQTIWVFPTLDMVVVMTSTAYGTRHGNRQPAEILEGYVLGAVL